MTHLPIVIPSDFEVLVAKNDTVKVGQVLAKKREVASDVVIELSERLRIEPKKVGKYLKKSPGDYIAKGEVLARKEGLFTDTLIVSEVEGTIAKFERDSGNITVRLTEDESHDIKSEEIVCPLDGKVSICHNDQIILETEKNVLLGEKGVGGTFKGVLKIINKKPKEEVEAEELGSSLIGCIIFAPAFSRETYAKASAIGVGGILTLVAIDTDMSYLEEKRLSLPLVQVSEEIGLKIAKWQNKEIFIDGQNKAILLLTYEKTTP